jgi:bifunctional NMN adenylyltransferase/nudix hydrolase
MLALCRAGVSSALPQSPFVRNNMRATPPSPPPSAPSPARPHQVAVLIGRFAPFHNRHLRVVRAALASYRRVAIVLGSSFRAPSPANPFSWQQRADMIGLCLTDEERQRVGFVPVRDHHRDERWGEEASRGVLQWAGVTNQRQFVVVNPEPADDAAPAVDWPRIFPRWGYAPLSVEIAAETGLAAATIRKVLFAVDHGARDAALAYLSQTVPDQVRHYLSAWWESPLREKLAQETEWIRQYRERWPAEQAMTTDAVVTCSNHVLLIERGEGAGAGLFALPGGFLEKNERFYDGAKRELREETGLGYIGDGLDVAFLRAEVFDRPDRSMRARIVTVAHLFDLKSIPPPDVQGRDDARHALWVPVAELAAMEERLFEDHFQILDHFLGLTSS